MPTITSSWRLAGLTLLVLALAPLGFSTRLLTAPMPKIVALKDMTWVELRTAVQAGATTAIVPTGGIEQNGPHMILGKHDYIVGAAAQEIALALGRTLVAPVVTYVPEGGFEPPSGHLAFAGTIGVSDQAFAGVLDGIARSLKLSGFKLIAFIGDHGASQPLQAEVAARLSKAWLSEGVVVASIDAYYDDKAQVTHLLAQGKSASAIGQHASIIDTSELLSVHPTGVDLARFREASLLGEATGVSGDPRSATAPQGATLLDMRIKAATAAIASLRDKHH